MIPLRHVANIPSMSDGAADQRAMLATLFWLRNFLESSPKKGKIAPPHTIIHFSRKKFTEGAQGQKHPVYTMSLSNKLAITDVDLKDKRVLIRVRPQNLSPHSQSIDRS
jgi:hypothetical protein